jgi:hypothetical protein
MEVVNMNLSVLYKLVDADKLGGWVRAGVAAGLGALIAKFPGVGGIVDPSTQTQIGIIVATIVVGVWSHYAKAVDQKDK